MRIRDPGWRQFVSGIRDGKKSDPGSGINIPDPPHCRFHILFRSKLSPDMEHWSYQYLYLRHCIASFWNYLLVEVSLSLQCFVMRPHWKWFFFLRRSILLPFMLCEPVKPSRLLKSSSNVSTVYWVIWCVYVKLSLYSRNVCTWWLMWSWWTVTQLPWAHPTQAEPGPTARYIRKLF